LVLVLGLAALYWFNTDPTGATVTETNGRQTWTIEPGDTVKLSADEVGPDDLYRCRGKGGVNGTPDPGHGVGGSGGFSVSTAADGTVTLTCEPGPPAEL
jgi:hypothetical protein